MSEKTAAGSVAIANVWARPISVSIRPDALMRRPAVRAMSWIARADVIPTLAGLTTSTSHAPASIARIAAVSESMGSSSATAATISSRRWACEVRSSAGNGCSM